MNALRASRSCEAPILESPIYSRLVHNSGISLMNVVPFLRVLTGLNYWIIPFILERVPSSCKLIDSRLQHVDWIIIISEEPDTVVGIVVRHAVLTLGNIDRLQKLTVAAKEFILNNWFPS